MTSLNHDARFCEYRSADADSYRMTYHDPHAQLESDEREIAVVDEALEVLAETGILPHTNYDHALFQAHRQAVRETFDIPWTAITPRMQRLLYAINAIHQPKVMIAAGVFCGNTFFSNAGAGAGPGKCYEADALIGVEIKPDEAERAERNVRNIDPAGVARVLAEDANHTVRKYSPVDLLYLDANDPEGGKDIYFAILQSAWQNLADDAIILAHNSINAAQDLAGYLAFVRNPENMAASVNVVFDTEGLEVSRRSLEAQPAGDGRMGLA
jgi:predicted O-methyltransferase YrrM